jgi:hypothetical protein
MPSNDFITLQAAVEGFLVILIFIKLWKWLSQGKFYKPLVPEIFLEGSAPKMLGKHLNSMVPSEILTAH